MVEYNKIKMEKEFVIKEINGYIVEWDAEKNEINKKKHGISFETAALVFADEHYLELYDDEHSINEDRYIAIGLVEDILFVVHTMRNENVRMISARLATNQERRFYYDSQCSDI